MRGDERCLVWCSRGLAQPNSIRVPRSSLLGRGSLVFPDHPRTSPVPLPFPHPHVTSNLAYTILFGDDGRCRDDQRSTPPLRHNSFVSRILARQQYTYLTNGNFSANLECGNHLLWRFFRGFSIQRNAAAPAKIIPAAKLTGFLFGKRNAHCAAYMKMKNRAIGTAKLCSFNFGSPSFR